MVGVQYLPPNNLHNNYIVNLRINKYHIIFILAPNIFICVLLGYSTLITQFKINVCIVGCRGALQLGGTLLGIPPGFIVYKN